LHNRYVRIWIFDLKGNSPSGVFWRALVGFFNVFAKCLLDAAGNYPLRDCSNSDKRSKSLRKGIRMVLAVGEMSRTMSVEVYDRKTSLTLVTAPW
jgi:hypothetical protein